MRPIALVAALSASACSAEPSAASPNIVAAPSDPGPVAETRPQAASVPTESVDTLALAGGAGDEAVAAVLAEAGRKGWTDVAVSRAQSFRMTRNGRDVATLVTGEGSLPNAAPGCFVAIRQAGTTILTPTIGYDNYEMEACGGPIAVGLLSSGDPVRIGTIFKASSPNAEVTEPVILSWDPTGMTLTIDETLSERASQAGARTIAAMRRIAN